MARLAVTAQLVFGVQMPLRLIPEAAAKRSDLSESASKRLGLAGFTQILYTDIAILCPRILDAGPQLNLAFSATFQAIAISHF